VPMRFFEAAPGRAIKTFVFAGFPFFTSKWNYCRVTGPQNKIFIKNQLTLLDILYSRMRRKGWQSGRMRTGMTECMSGHKVEWGEMDDRMHDMKCKCWSWQDRKKERKVGGKEKKENKLGVTCTNGMFNWRGRVTKKSTIHYK
jgi:hypothetical protein